MQIFKPCGNVLLQDAVDRDNINCDSYLEQVFGCKRMRFMEIPQRLQSLLHQPDPLVLTHTIQYNDGSEKNTACYDIGMLQIQFFDIMCRYNGAGFIAGSFSAHMHSLKTTISQDFSDHLELLKDRLKSIV